MKRILSAALCLLGAFLCAHEVTLSIRDGDLDMPLEGARVRTHTGQTLEADAQGLARFSAPDDREVVILVDYPGYQTRKVVCKGGDSVIAVNMLLEGMSESRELVVEGKRADRTDEKTGESVAIKKEKIQETAKIGLVEDVMSSIKTLPGVGFTGGWNAMPSIRGGDPSDLAACLDGFYVDSPYHWGGAYSIFNPNMVESAKLSHGVFSVKHGNASSALLEVTSIESDPDNVRTDLAVTTSAVELGVSLPLAGRGGVFLGGKLTYWDPFVYAAGLVKPSVADTIAQSPYIRDAYLKANYRPGGQSEVYLNGFLGSDGIGVRSTEESQDSSGSFSSESRFDYDNQLGYLSGGIKVVPAKNILVNCNLGAGYDSMKIYETFGTSGSRNYSDAFISLYGNQLGLAKGDSYAIQDNSLTGVLYSKNTSLQGRLDGDWEIAPWLEAGFGLDEIARGLHNEQTVDGWNTVLDGYDAVTGEGTGHTLYNEAKLANDGSTTYSSGAYALLNLHSADKRFSTELGARADHLYFTLGDYVLNTLPVFNPRLSVSYDAVRNGGPVDHLTLSLGSGLFSRLTPYQDLIDENSGLEGFDLKPDRSWNSVAGMELQLGSRYKFSLEGYYKKVFDRSYFNESLTNPDQTLFWHFDGQAEIFGFDVLLQKLTSRHLDGWVTYSFNYARYRNPVLDPGTDGNSGGPLSTDWYYPSFHRFHTANIVLDWKPAEGLDFLAKVSIASGKPLDRMESLACYAIRQSDGTYAEYWKQITAYSDSNRTSLSIPVDLKFTWTRYGRDKKTRTQIYVAVEDVFTNVYHSKGNTTISQYTGEEVPDSGAADFSIGIPMPSIGMSWSY